MFRPFDNFREFSVRRFGHNTHTGLIQNRLIADIDLITVTVTFGNSVAAINAADKGIGSQYAFISSQTHSPAQIAVFGTNLFSPLFIPLGHQTDNRSAAAAGNFGGIGVFDAGQVAHGFNDGHLHSETNSQKRQIIFAGIFNRLDFALGAAGAETARNQNRTDIVQVSGGTVFFNIFRIYPFDFDFVTVGYAAVAQSFAQRFISFEQLGVFPDNGHSHFTFRMGNDINDFFPFA